MSARAVVITGAQGGIGTALVQAFSEAGWAVVATGRRAPNESAADHFLIADLNEIGTDENAALRLAAEARARLDGAPIAALVNNAAIQHLGATDEIGWDQWRETLAVNLSAPFALTRAFLPDLEAAKGCVLNIGSVHAQSTKPAFVAYATSKAALHGLTRALAVDLGPRARCVCLAPAAIATPMLLAGFEGRPEAFAELQAFHPVGRIGSPEETAKAALFLVSPDAAFASGTTVYLDGGVLSRLHDPV